LCLLFKEFHVRFSMKVRNKTGFQCSFWFSAPY